jgi:hypothetical protein
MHVQKGLYDIAVTAGPGPCAGAGFCVWVEFVVVSGSVSPPALVQGDERVRSGKAAGQMTGQPDIDSPGRIVPFSARHPPQSWR